MKARAFACAAVLIFFGLGQGAFNGAFAQEKTAQQQEIDRIKAQTDLVQARADYEKAVADRISGLNLPNFKGTATAENGAGELEANMLAAEAVGEAATEIVGRLRAIDQRGPTATAGEASQSSDASDIADTAADLLASFASARSAGPSCQPPEFPATTASGNRFVLLAAQEPFDLGAVDFVRGQLAIICTNLIRELPRSALSGERILVFNQSPVVSTDPTPVFSGGIGLPIQIASAVFAALRSEVTVSGLDTEGITDRLLVTAVASRLGRQAILPAAPTIARPSADGGTFGIEYQVNQLLTLRSLAIAHRDGPALRGEARTEDRDRITALVSRLDTFLTSVTTADPQGNLPLARAARLERLMAAGPAGQRPYIVRLHVDRSGGSLINTRNIATYVGADPLRVTGGLVASFTATDASDGSVVAADIFSCRTALVRLRRVQDGTWRSAGRQPRCR